MGCLGVTADVGKLLGGPGLLYNVGWLLEARYAVYGISRAHMLHFVRATTWPLLCPASCKPATSFLCHSGAMPATLSAPHAAAGHTCR